MLRLSSGSPLIEPMYQAMRGGMPPQTFGNQWLRSFSKVRIAQFGPHPKPIDTIESGEKAIDDIISFAKAQELFTNPTGQVTFATLPEFWANGWPNANGTENTYDAERTVSLATFSAIVQRVRLLAGQEAPGTVLIGGGVAVDTGKKLFSGKTLGVNVGFIVETGKAGKTALFSKKQHDKNDGWDEDKYSAADPDYESWDKALLGPGEIAMNVGALVQPIEDPSGGRAVTFTVVICADMTSNLPAQTPTSDLILATAHGTPWDWQSNWQSTGKVSEYALIAVNDSSGPFDVTGPQGVYRYGPVSKHPRLAGFHALADWAGFGDFVLAAYKWLFAMPSTEVLAKQFGFEQITTTTRQSDGLKVNIAGPRTIGPDSDRT
jgi:hypothetical protein